MSDLILPRLDVARRDLLDLGLRNALVNHGTRARQVRVVDERAQEIYCTLVKEGRAMVFDPLAEETASTAVKATGDAAARVEELDWNTLLAQPEVIGASSMKRKRQAYTDAAATEGAAYPSQWKDFVAATKASIPLDPVGSAAHRLMDPV